MISMSAQEPSEGDVGTSTKNLLKYIFLLIPEISKCRIFSLFFSRFPTRVNSNVTTIFAIVFEIGYWKRCTSILLKMFRASTHVLGQPLSHKVIVYRSEVKRTPRLCELVLDPDPQGSRGAAGMIHSELEGKYQNLCRHFGSNFAGPPPLHPQFWCIQKKCRDFRS